MLFITLKACVPCDNGRGGEEGRGGGKSQELGAVYKDAWRRSTHHPFVRKIEMVRNGI